MVITAEVKQIKQLAREIACDKLGPLASEIDRNFGFPREGLRYLAEAGLMGLTVPTAFGGAGADTVSFVEATQEIAHDSVNKEMDYGDDC